MNPNQIVWKGGHGVQQLILFSIFHPIGNTPHNQERITLIEYQFIIIILLLGWTKDSFSLLIDRNDFE